MPRQPGLDAPDTFHHVMVRGSERSVVSRDDPDRADFVARVAQLPEQGAWTVYAWARVPNHARLLVRTRNCPLPRSMYSLLTGNAGTSNRRHHRVGHLFQNRYKSIVVEEEPYFLELVPKYSRSRWLDQLAECQGPRCARPCEVLDMHLESGVRSLRRDGMVGIGRCR